MNAQTLRRTVAGPAGAIECAIDTPAAPLGLALLCHPHPQHGGTMDNKVVQTLARALLQMGYTAVRFNFRGVGASQGHWDQGQGEVDDAQAVLQALHDGTQPLALGGFSFGAFIATQLAARLGPVQRPERLILVGPAVGRFQIAAVPAQTLVVHGEEDEVVPLAAVLDWARPQGLPVTVLPGTGHFFHGRLSTLRHIVHTAARITAWPTPAAPTAS